MVEPDDPWVADEAAAGPTAAASTTLAIPALEKQSSQELCGGQLTTYHDKAGRSVRVWMPRNYGAVDSRAGNASEKLPSLWLNDAQNVFQDEVAFGGVSWGAAATVADLIDAGVIPPVAIVGIDNNGSLRAFDYLPRAPGIWGGMRSDMSTATGGGVDAYADYVMGLLAWSEQELNLSPLPSHRVFGGSSFGGIAVLYTVMRHPTAFGGALVESPSFWAADGKLLRDVTSYAGQWPERLYLCMGGREYTGTRPNSGDAGGRCDAFLVNACREFATALEKRGLHAGRLDWHIDNVAGHNEHAWRWRFPRAVRWLLGKEDLRPDQSSEAKFWTQPPRLVSGRPFELYVHPTKVALPSGKHWLVHLGFDGWSRDLQDAPLPIAGLPRSGGSRDVAYLVARLRCPEGARSVHFAFKTEDGSAWDNNGGSNYELAISSGGNKNF